MEAIRPAQTTTAVSEDSRVQDEVDELPPPPAPFPIELLSNLDTIVRPNLTSLQSSCISALTSILPPEVSPAAQWQLSPDDQSLAAALTELLEVSYELETFHPPVYAPTPDETATSQPPSAAMSREGSFAALESHLTNLQASASTSRGARTDLHPAINVVREELAWNRVDTLSRAVLEFVRARNTHTPIGEAEGTSQHVADHPPEYSDTRDHDLPSYSAGEHSAVTDSKEKSDDSGTHSRETTSSAPSEKMMHELEAVTSAIERLQSVAPRFQEQRVSMPVGSSSRTPAPLASATATVQTKETAKSRKAAEKQKMKELEEIWDRIERAHGKRKAREDEQRADMDGVAESTGAQRERFLQSLYDQAEASRMQGQDGAMRAVDKELAKARDLRDRDHFLRELIEKSADGRLADQDSSATFPHNKAYVLDLIARAGSSRLASQDYTAPVPIAQGDTHDPRELVTMRDFFATSKPPAGNGACGEIAQSKPVAEPMSTGEEKEGTLKKLKGMMRRRSSSALSLLNGPSSSTNLSGVGYICEHQERLSSLDIRIFGPGLSSLKDPLTLEPSPNDPQFAILTSKSTNPLRINLPTPALPFTPIPLETHDTFLRAKLRTSPSPNTAMSTPFHLPPLPASELRAIQPTGLCCATCDHPVACFISSRAAGGAQEGTKEGGAEEVKWKDLPSEHWAEMMEVWMCHSDPSFTARLTKHTETGFWPSRATVLVGGSYLLVHPDHILPGTKAEGKPFDDWQTLTCSCGEILGKQRCLDGRPGEGSVRFSKWAITLHRDGRPEPARYLLSAFNVSDMLELLSAHASHHFIVSSEENHERRLVMWLWNPSISISWSRTTTPESSSSAVSPLKESFFPLGKSGTALLPARGSARAAKVLYHVLASPEESITAFSGFSGKRQVETLTYPSGVCDWLISALQESTSLYPAEERMSGKYDVGFLERAD